MPPATSPATTTSMPMPGHWKFLRRLSIEVRRHANSGPTPVRNSRNRPIGTINRLNQTASRLIFSVENFSERTGNMVPHSTAKQLASSIEIIKQEARLARNDAFQFGFALQEFETIENQPDRCRDADGKET